MYTICNPAPLQEVCCTCRPLCTVTRPPIAPQSPPPPARAAGLAGHLSVRPPAPTLFRRPEPGERLKTPPGTCCRVHPLPGKRHPRELHEADVGPLPGNTGPPRPRRILPCATWSRPHDATHLSLNKPTCCPAPWTWTYWGGGPFFCPPEPPRLARPALRWGATRCAQQEPTFLFRLRCTTTAPLDGRQMAASRAVHCWLTIFSMTFATFACLASSGWTRFRDHAQ